VTVSCAHCGGRSRVVETRQLHQKQRDRSHATINLIRWRQCLDPKCRWSWRTIERTYSPRKTNGKKVQEAETASDHT